MNQATNLRSRPEEISRLHVGIVYQVMSIEAMEKSTSLLTIYMFNHNQQRSYNKLVIPAQSPNSLTPSLYYPFFSPPRRPPTHLQYAHLHSQPNPRVPLPLPLRLLAVPADNRAGGDRHATRLYALISVQNTYSNDI